MDVVTCAAYSHHQNGNDARPVSKNRRAVIGCLGGHGRSVDEKVTKVKAKIIVSIEVCSKMTRKNRECLS